MAMLKKKNKLDKISVSILSAFLLMTGTHLGCRYDVGAMADKLFQKVSAATVAPAPQMQDPIAAAPVTIPSAEEAATIAQPSIARNPFLVPVAARPTPVQTQRTPLTAPNNAGLNNISGSAPVAAPVATPHVKGVIRSNGRSVAIVEYKGHSGTYAVGASIGDGYTVNSISGKTVSINGSSVNLGGSR